jgi:uncharacterized phiE125 gp8 family phage protein
MQHSSLHLVTAPTDEPVTLAEAKLHLRVTQAHEDTLITALISAAREHVEGVTGRVLMPQTWAVGLTAFPGSCGGIELPRPPLAEVLSFTTYAEAGIGVEMAGGWQVVADSGPMAQPGKVYPATGTSWPAITGDGMRRVVHLTYRCGYASAATVPAPLKAAMLLTIGDLYENREGGISFRGGAPRAITANPTVERLLSPYRVVSVR